MPLERKDRVKDQTQTTGTGTLTIDGVAATGFRTITSAHTTGATLRYTVVNTLGTEWEVGEGIWTTATNTLTRATVYASSNAGALVNFSAGIKAVFCGPTAQDLIDAAATNVANTFTAAQVISVNSSSDALRITQAGGGNSLLVEDSANPDSTPFVIDASGYIISGATSKRATNDNVTPRLQLHGLSNDDSSFGLTDWQTTGFNGPFLNLAKSKGGAVGTRGIVAAQDRLGFITWGGDDGTAFIPAARIESYVDGTPGTNDMPGRLSFSTTADGAATTTERMRIRNDGNIGVGGAGGASSRLQIGGTFPSSGGFGTAFESAGTVPAATTTLHTNFDSKAYTEASAFTLGQFNHFSATQPGTFGTGSTVSAQYGFRAYSTLTGGTSNFGFYSDIASGANRWNFYANGTASNVFAGQTSLGGLVGAEALRATPVASAVNYLNATGAVTTARPTLSVAGSDTDVGMNITTKGVGGLFFYSGNTANRGFAISGVASAVNYVQANPSATGNAVSLSAEGTDTDVSFRLYARGAGSVQMFANGVLGFTAYAQPAAVNYGAFTGTATGTSPLLQVLGSDTNVDFRFRTQGTGAYQFDTGANGNTQFRIANTASAVNYLQASGGATGAGALLSAQGSDAAVALNLSAKGGASLGFYTNSYTNLALALAHVASSVNYVQINGNATGAAPTISAQGSDSNINLTLTPKGTGIVTTPGILQASGGIRAGSGALPVYETNLDFGADVGGTWRRLIVISMANVQYSTHGFVIEVTNPEANHATTGSINTTYIETYYVACVRTNDVTLDTPDACYVSGPGTLIRAVKTSTGNYEVQVQNTAQYREYRIRIYTYATNGGHTITYENGSTVGSTGTAQYTATVSTGVTDRFQRIYAASAYINSAGNEYARSWTLVASNNQNARSNFGLINSTAGASATVNLSRIGGTGNNYCDWELFDNNGTPYDQFGYGSAVSYARWVFNGSERMRIASGGVISLGGAPGAESLRVTPVASAVNYVNVSGAVTTGYPSITVAGSDTNIGLSISPKGAAPITFTKGYDTATSNAYVFDRASGLTGDAGGAAFWRGFHIGAGTVVFSGSNTFPRFGIAFEYNSYTDPTTRNLYLSLSNTSNSHNVVFGNNSGGNFQFSTRTSTGSTASFEIVPGSTHVNWLQATGATTGNTPVLSAQGSDTNINLSLQPKGTGSIVLGALTGILKAAAGVVSVATSGVDFKTVGGTSILGSGNIEVGDPLQTFFYAR